ncbi:hypothetical protein ACHHYP_03086 [Achlya hypogyna]|uniref:Transmembrane protein n=1 Tax=Achlya hypogyna TaxID=1202772 RepID=A0A1V9Z4M6_ACHHY|nr:hypothetical protein ACHHYP_03086 [Achlya hypogyna]
MRATWSRLAAVVDLDLFALYTQLAKQPALAANEALHVTALLGTTMFVYSYLKIAPAWLWVVAGEYDLCFFILLTVVQFAVYRTRIDDMLAPFFMVLDSSVLKDLFQLLSALGALISLVFLSFSDPANTATTAEFFLGPHLTPHVLFYLPSVLHQVFIVLRLAGLLLLLQWMLYVVTLPYVHFRRAKRLG